MSTPEILPPQPQVPEVTHIAEKFEIPETAQQLGITTPPVNPAPLKLDDQVVATPSVTSPSDPTVFQVPSDTGAHNMKELERLAKGDIALSRTWYDAQWVRQIQKAIKSGLTAIFN